MGRWKVQRVLGVVGVVLAACGSGCASGRFNPDFPATDAELARDRERMAAEPVGLERPLVVLDGWHAPGLGAARIARELRRLTGASEGMVLRVSYPWAMDLRKVAAQVVERVESRWPSGADGETVEVDVVGISMGGIVARAAALPIEGVERRLRIRRLFTLSSPHRGARMARWVRLDASSALLAPGSEFLRRLDEGLASGGYEVVAYARLNDWLVGSERSAPEGREVIWTDGPWLVSHFVLSWDKRALTDIARRLRGEAPWARPGPLPGRAVVEER